MSAGSLRTLDVDECMALMTSGYVGRLAFIQDGRPAILPLNYLFDQGAVLFRTGYGQLVETVHGTPVAFEVDDFDVADHSGWSVVVHGIAEEVWDVGELERLRGLPLRPWADGTRDHYVRITPTALTGRRVGL